jgi:hypothetical protein
VPGLPVNKHGVIKVDQHHTLWRRTAESALSL